MKKLISFFLLMLAASLHAQPLTFITITGTGSLSDTALRQAAPAIEKHTGRQVVVLNMPGGDGLVALRHFQNTAGSVLVGNSALSYLEATGRLSAQPHPLGGLTKSDMAVYSKASSLNELIGKRTLTAGSTSPMVEMALRVFDDEQGTKTTPVGYKQFGQAVIDLAAGRLDYLLAPVGSGAIEGMVATGKITRVHVIGPLFTWSAFFTMQPNPLLARQLGLAIAETKFSGSRAFIADAEGVLAVQKQEFNLIARLLPLEQ
jgi:tripartite-type tricarboxylate transporter receptor subunit TctC